MLFVGSGHSVFSYLGKVRTSCLVLWWSVIVIVVMKKKLNWKNSFSWKFKPILCRIDRRIRHIVFRKIYTEIIISYHCDSFYELKQEKYTEQKMFDWITQGIFCSPLYIRNKFENFSFLMKLRNIRFEKLNEYWNIPEMEYLFICIVSLWAKYIDPFEIFERIELNFSNFYIFRFHWTKNLSHFEEVINQIKLYQSCHLPNLN